ncbi:MAG: alpha-E domain-containing protein [Comamonadaceae bacterium]|nr:alpha-E domain-containing protein [Comamonadaceae bacterium]
MQRGGTSLDTWVLTDGPVDTVLDAAAAAAGRRHRCARRRPVTSRTGENLFWLGRYTERTEQLVRLARATLLLHRRRRATPPTPVQRALSALAVRSGLAPPGVPTLAAGAAPVRARAAAPALRRRRRRGQRRLQPARRWSARRMALRERLSAEQWGADRARCARASRCALEAARASCRRCRRCCRRWTGWRCSWPP